MNPENLRFSLFSGLFVVIWKFITNYLKLKRGKDDKLNGMIAGFIAGSALIIEEKSRRLLYGQQILLRGLQVWLTSNQTCFPGMFSNHFNAFLFMVAAGEFVLNVGYVWGLFGLILFVLVIWGVLRSCDGKSIDSPFLVEFLRIDHFISQYAYAIRPTSIPKAYYTFIRNTGPISEQVLNLVRKTVRGGTIADFEVKKALDTQSITKTNQQLVFGSSTFDVVGCCVMHSQTDYCLENALHVFWKVFKVILPVYFSLNLVPTVVLKFKEFLKG